MSILSPGVDDIVLDSDQTLGVATPKSFNTIPSAYTNQTVVYVQGTTYTSDVNYQTNDQSFSLLESITSQISPDLPCSISGAKSISFSISNYLTTPPSWVTISSSSGILSITSPEVSVDTEYSFYINSAVSGVITPVKKLIKLTILNCSPTNCMKCISTNNLE